MKEYAAMLAMAIMPIYTGSRSSVVDSSSKQFEWLDEMDTQDAIALPFIAGGTLIVLFILLTYISQKWINLFINGYLAVTGIGALMFTLQSLRSWLQVPRGRPLLRRTLHSQALDLFMICSFSASLLLTAVHLYTKHPLASNAIALSFAHTAIAIIKIDSFQTAGILLIGLFVYDITFVFGSTVMVTVARGIDAPVKLILPGPTNSSAPTMLGLGDIVVPGLVIAIARRYDASFFSNQHRLFYTCFGAYLLSLIGAMSASAIFQHPQPALLYISPGIIASILAFGYVKSEIKSIWTFTTNSGREAEKKKDNSDTTEILHRRQDH